MALFSFLPPYRVLMVRVYERTGSLFISILMHASLTASMIFFGPAVKGAESVIYNLIFATTLVPPRSSQRKRSPVNVGVRLMLKPP